MVAPKKRTRESEVQNPTDESLKLRKRLRAVISSSTVPNVDHVLVETFVKMLKSSLFMHHSRLMEIRSVVEQIDAESDRLKGVCQLLDILRRPPAVHSFLSDMLLLFLTPEEAVELGCLEAYRSRTQTLEILVKAVLYQRAAKCRALPKGPLKLLYESDSPDTVDPSSIYESLYAWFGNDARLRDFILPLFPDQPVDSSNVTLGEMELVRSDDLLRDQETDEFEVINWTDAFDNELPSFRQCTCLCHQGAASASGQPNSHCGLCAIKFFGEHAYIWRGSRLVRAQIELFDNEELRAENVDDAPTAASPTKLFSPSYDVIDNCEWADILRAVDAMEDDDATAAAFSSPSVIEQQSAEKTPQKSTSGESPGTDVLKHAFMETFGRHLWGKGYSPFKRPSQGFGIGGSNEESNSASYVFVRGFDGANTMLGTVAADSNTGTIPCFSQASFGQPGTSETMPGTRTPPGTLCSTVDETPSKEPPHQDPVGAEGNGAEEEEEESWSEDEDRYLLEQFKLHGNIYEAGTAAMAKLQRSRHVVRDRLKLLLDLLKEAV